MSKLRVPSKVSAVAESHEVLRLLKGGTQIGSVSASALGDVVRLDVGVPIVARGDLLSPAFRRDVATDTRLCYSSCRSDRTDLLRLLSDAAVAWDAHLSATSCRSR
jgi:hypothetical protein